ncbi:MAG: hypothetical protein ACREN5_12620, partial [Gemmatimonadales bacterium]
GTIVPSDPGADRDPRVGRAVGRRMTAGVVLLAALQAAPLDQGVLAVRRDSVEVARESFRLQGSRLSSGASGWIVTTTSQYGADLALSAIVEVGPDSLALFLQYDVQHPSRPYRVLGRSAAGRMVLRHVSPRSERARELPTGPALVILDDSLFATYAVAAWFAGQAPQAVTAVYPRAGRRETLTIRDEGETHTMVNGDVATARHVVLSGGVDGPAHIWVSRDGRLLKVELPAHGVSAERQP